MSLVVPREVAVTYAGVTFGNGAAGLYADRMHLDRPFRLRKSKLDFEWRCRVTVTMQPGDTDADFAAACAIVEAAFITPRSTLTVAFNSSTHVSFAEASTAYAVAATVEKAGETGPNGPDTRRSRSYDAVVTGSVPASDRSDFLRALEWSLTYSSSRRKTLEITGTYTRNTTTGATAVYLAGIGSRAGAIQTLVGGGVFEIADESERGNVDDTELTFRRVYEEVIYNQATGVLDDARIVRQALAVRRSRPAPGDSRLGATKARRLQRATVTYAASIDKTSTVDLDGLYRSTVRPWLLVASRALLGSTTVALVDDTPVFDGPENRISATLELLATRDSSLLSCRVSQRTDFDPATVVRKLWNEPGDVANGTAPGAYLLQTPCTIRRTRTTVTETLGADAAPVAPSPGDAGGARGGSGMGIFGLGQAIGVGFGPNSLLDVFGVGGQLDVGAAPDLDRDAREASRGSPSSPNGGTDAPQWIPCLPGSVDQEVVTYGGDGGEFEVTRTTRVDAWEWLSVRTPPTAGGGANGGGSGDAQSVVRARS